MSHENSLPGAPVQSIPDHNHRPAPSQMGTNGQTTSDAGDALKPIARKAKTQVATLRRASGEKLEAAADAANRAIDTAQTGSEAALRTVNDYAVENPLKSIMIAFAAGFILKKMI